MAEKDLFKLLSPLKQRMHVNKALHCFFVSLLAAGGAGLILSYLSLFLPVPYLMSRLLLLLLVAVLAGILISAFLGPGPASLISTADSLGLKERVVTAWQLRDDNTNLAKLQREDARNIILNTDFKRLYPLRFPSKTALALAACIFLIAVSFAIPGYAREEARRTETLTEAIKQQLGTLEEAEKGLKKEGVLEEKELKKVLEELKSLKESLKEVTTAEDALKALSRAENELDKLNIQKQLHRLEKALSGNKMTGALAEALSNRDADDLKQALERLMQQIEEEKISPKELAKMLEEAAAQLGNKEISEMLQKEVQKIAEADTSSQLDGMEGLSDLLTRVMEDGGESSTGQALGQISRAIGQAKGAISRIDSQSGSGGKGRQSEGQAGGSEGEGQEVQSGAGRTDSQGSGQQGQGSGQQGSGQGQGESREGQGGQGQGNGQQQGNSLGGDAGGGAGEGSTNEDAGDLGSGSKDSGGAGRKPGERKEGEYEQLYDPSRLGGSNTPDQVSGQKQEGGRSQYSESDNIPLQKGQMSPYHEVVAKYRDEAAAYMEDTVIPAAMKQIVREYFESLE